MKKVMNTIIVSLTMLAEEIDKMKAEENERSKEHSGCVSANDLGFGGELSLDDIESLFDL